MTHGFRGFQGFGFYKRNLAAFLRRLWNFWASFYGIVIIEHWESRLGEENCYGFCLWIFQQALDLDGIDMGNKVRLTSYLSIL